MPKVRVVYKPDKTVAIIHYISKSKLTEQEAFARAMQGELKGLPYDDIDSSQLPQTREDRNAWERNPNGRGIVINQIKAQQLKNNNLNKGV